MISAQMGRNGEGKRDQRVVLGSSIVLFLGMNWWTLDMEQHMGRGGRDKREARSMFRECWMDASV